MKPKISTMKKRHPALTLKFISLSPKDKDFVFFDFWVCFLENQAIKPPWPFLRFRFPFLAVTAATPFPYPFSINRTWILRSVSMPASFKRAVLKDSNTLRCFCSLLWPAFSHTFPQASNTWEIMCPIWIR